MWPGDERGSVLLLGLGVAVIVVAVIAVVADAAMLQLHHRQARLTAEAAARAGAQALDLDSYYGSGHGRLLPIDDAAGRRLATRYLRQDPVGNDWRITGFEVTNDAVHVEVARRVRLPFTGSVSARSVTVTASGTAELRELRPR